MKALKSIVIAIALLAIIAGLIYAGGELMLNVGSSNSHTEQQGHESSPSKLSGSLTLQSNNDSDSNFAQKRPKKNSSEDPESENITSNSDQVMDKPVYHKRPKTFPLNEMTDKEKDALSKRVISSIENHKQSTEVSDWSATMTEELYNKFHNNPIFESKNITYINNDCRAESCLMTLQAEAIPIGHRHREAILNDRAGAVTAAMVQSGITADNSVKFQLEDGEVRVIISPRDEPKKH